QAGKSLPIAVARIVFSPLRLLRHCGHTAISRAGSRTGIRNGKLPACRLKVRPEMVPPSTGPMQNRPADTFSTHGVCPLLNRKDHTARSVFRPEALLREAR